MGSKHEKKGSSDQRRVAPRKRRVAGRVTGKAAVRLIRVAARLNNKKNLETVVLQGICPICQDDVDACDYPSCNEVHFCCCTCDWEMTYNLSDAKELGYYIFWDNSTERGLWRRANGEG